MCYLIPVVHIFYQIKKNLDFLDVILFDLGVHLYLYTLDAESNLTMMGVSCEQSCHL